MPEGGRPRPLTLGRLVEDQVLDVRSGIAEVRLDLGAVHDARVALRRLRATLQVFRTVLDDVPVPLVADLRWFAQQIASTRDAEVAAERLAPYATTTTDRDGAALVRSHLSGWAQEAAATARAAFVAERTDHLLAALGRLHLSAARGPEIYLEVRTQRLAVRTLEDLGDELPVAVARACADGITPGRRARLLHVQRKRVKTARAVTAVLSVPGRERAVLTRALKATQELLGDHHDASVLRSWLGGVARDEPAAARFVRDVRRAERAATARVEDRLPRSVARLAERIDRVRSTPAVHLPTP